jgi:hydrogenase maturation protease
MRREDPVVPLVIIGMGNHMRHDDGVGLEVLTEVRRCVPDGADTQVEFLLLDGEPTRLIDAWTGRAQAVVIDAAYAAGDPGTIYRVDVDDGSFPEWLGGASSHSAGLAAAVGLGRALNRIPDKMVVFGIEPEDCSFGVGLSESVMAAMPSLVEQVCAEVWPPKVSGPGV